MPRVHVRTKLRSQDYEITIGHGLLARTGSIARKGLNPTPGHVALISNKRVFGLYGETVSKSLVASGFRVSSWLLREGERHKTLDEADRLIRFLQGKELERSDAVIALGGGVVGDLAGFAASVFLRGVQFIQIPTTLLAQVDASVGGKTGVNLPLAKNAIGTFHQPRAVVIDVNTLQTLPPRDLVAGWCEAVKQGAVASKPLFKQTTNLLSSINGNQPAGSSQLEELIAAHCAFKASVVAADEREDSLRRDRRSRRVLNFGHTIAHALEAVTNYERFRHGEAVGHGILVAAELSKNLGLLPQSELELLKEGVRLCGPLPRAHDLSRGAIVNALTLDKKRSGGHVQWVLLERIGKPKIVDAKHIKPQLLTKSLRAGLELK